MRDIFLKMAISIRINHPSRYISRSSLYENRTTEVAQMEGANHSRWQVAQEASEVRQLTRTVPALSSFHVSPQGLFSVAYCCYRRSVRHSTNVQPSKESHMYKRMVQPLFLFPCTTAGRSDLRRHNQDVAQLRRAARAQVWLSPSSSA